jgi:hypothetical protein
MRVINFHDGEDDNVYVETDDMLMYYMSLEEWDTIEVPEEVTFNPIAKATYLLHYQDCFQTVGVDN